jgi:hypothetical protein
MSSNLTTNEIKQLQLLEGIIKYIPTLKEQIYGFLNLDSVGSSSNEKKADKYLSYLDEMLSFYNILYNKMIEEGEIASERQIKEIEEEYPDLE